MEKKYAKLRYHGEGGALFGLLLVNALLTVLTLGIYSFWGRTKVRQFHYNETEMDGDRFAYHGTGGELLVGALKAAGIMFVTVIVVSLAAFGVGYAIGAQQTPAASPLFTLLFYGAFSLLMILAINGARRYRLSRSSWRGIRFNYHGGFGAYLGLIVTGGLLTILTLGFYSPFFANKRRAFFVNNVRFGSEPFEYKGEGRALFGPWITALLLTIPTLGLSWIWYAAFQHRHFWNHTQMRGGRFQSSVEGKDLLVLQLTNLLLVIVTLGIGTPWVMTRTMGFFCDHLMLVGTVDWASIEQRAQTATGTGEGLAEGLDVDVGIGM